MSEIKPVAWKCGDDLYLTSSNRCDKCIPLYTADALAAARDAALEEAIMCCHGGSICDPQQIADAIRALKEKR